MAQGHCHLEIIPLALLLIRTLWQRITLMH